MTRNIVLLFAITYLCWPQTPASPPTKQHPNSPQTAPQPTQQAAVLPSVVKLEKAPTTFQERLFHLAEIVIPPLIGIIAVVVAAWMNSRNNARMEIARAEIAAQAKERDNKWAFRKDIYLRLIASTGELLRFYYEIRRLKLSDGAAFEDERVKARGEFTAITDKLMTDFCLASLDFHAPPLSA